MAGLSDMSQANYSDIERGVTRPSIESLLKFASILEVSVDVLTRNELPAQPEVREAASGRPYVDIIEEKNKRIQFLESLVLTLAQQEQ